MYPMVMQGMPKKMEDVVAAAIAAQERVDATKLLERAADTIEMLSETSCPHCNHAGVLEPGMEDKALRCEKCGFVVHIYRDFSEKYGEYIKRFFRGTLDTGLFPGMGRVFVAKHMLGQTVRGEDLWLEVLCVETPDGALYKIAVRFPLPNGYRAKGEDVYAGFVCTGNGSLAPVNMGARPK